MTPVDRHDVYIYECANLYNDVYPTAGEEINHNAHMNFTNDAPTLVHCTYVTQHRIPNTLPSEPALQYDLGRHEVQDKCRNMDKCNFEC